MPNVVGRVLLGLLPLWILLFELIAFPESMDPVTANPPAVAGLPAGVIFVGIALAVMAVGIEVLHVVKPFSAARVRWVDVAIGRPRGRGTGAHSHRPELDAVIRGEGTAAA
jgi:hypothetical protein